MRYFLVVIGLVLVAAAPPYEKIFRGKYYNFYDRAMHYMAHDDWTQAENDLKKALEMRESDQEWARTYGVHFIDYFPNREMGVVLFNKGEYQKAKELLEKSNKAVETAKAKYYLEMVEEKLILASKTDEAAPSLTIEFPIHHSDIYIPAFETEISGQAKDDLRVVAFYANDQRIVIEPGQEAAYQSTLRGLKKGDNPFQGKAVDLTGKEALVEHNIVVDLDGPVISISEIVPGEGGAQIVKGQVSDNNLLSSLHVQGKPIDVYKKKDFSFEVPVTLAAGQDLEIIAKDLAGNPARVVRKLEAGALPAQIPAEDKEGPEFLDPKEELAFFTSLAGIRISVRDPGGVAELFVNGEARPIKPGKVVSTQQLIPVNEGQNKVTLKVKDAKGNETVKEINVTRYVPAISKVESHLSIAVAPPVYEGDGGKVALVPKFESLLAEEQRFNVKPGLWGDNPPIEYEKAGQLKLEDIAKLAKDAKVDAIMIGKIEHRGNAVNATFRLVDAKTATLVRTLDAYQDDDSSASLEYMSRLLSHDLQNTYPLVDGKVLKVSGDKIMLKFTEPKGIRKTARAIVYTEGEAIVDPDTGESLGAMTEEVAELQVTQISDKLVTAEVISGEAAKITQGQKVIIK